MLTRAACQLIEGPTGRAGIGLARAHRPHLILMGVRLLDRSGREATRVTRAIPRRTPFRWSDSTTLN
jgi:hypothetical protein